MRRTTMTLFIAFALLLLSGIFVAAQSTQLNMLQPAVVNVTQAVPVNVTLGGIVGGQMVTLTAPMTVNVALQIRLEGRGATVTTAGQAAPAQAAQPAAASSGTVFNDTRGIPYKTDVPAPFALTQVASNVNSLDMLEVVGEIKNAGTSPMRFVEAIVTFYKDGKIVNVSSGFTMVSELAPGQSAPFKVMTTLKGDLVNAYTVQVQGQKK